MTGIFAPLIARWIRPRNPQPKEQNKMTAKRHFANVPDFATVRIPIVQIVTGLNEQTIFRLIQQNQFPKPMQADPKNAAWKLGDIRAWVADHAEVEP